jgi:hypothetical protein
VIPAIKTRLDSFDPDWSLFLTKYIWDLNLDTEIQILSEQQLKAVKNICFILRIDITDIWCARYRDRIFVKKDLTLEECQSLLMKKSLSSQQISSMWDSPLLISEAEYWTPDGALQM